MHTNTMPLVKEAEALNAKTPATERTWSWKGFVMEEELAIVMTASTKS